MTKTPKSYPSRTIAVLLLLLLAGVASRLISLPSTHGREGVTSGPAPLSFRTNQQSCCDQDGGKTHLLAASYYRVANNMVATLMLNNKGPEPIEVKPTLFTLTGERLEAAPVIVEGESFRNIDLGTFGALPGSPFEEGSLQLFHRGPDLVIGAQLYLVDEEHSLSFDEKLTEYQGAVSTQLESVWWLPSRRSTVSLILSNTSDLELTAQAVVNAGTSDPQTVDVTLSPHETRVINAQREHPNSKDDVGSASIHYSGPKGSLIARALIADKSSGYSLSAQFYSPQGGKSSSYQGVGLRLGTARGDDLTPIVVARNVGEVPTDLSGRMPYTAIDGSTGVVTLPGVRLAPGEASRIDIEHAIKKTIRSREISTAGLEFDYTSPPGSVMMSTVSVSDDRNQVFRVPMWDVPAQRNGSGGYPWFIKGSSSTFVYIKNVTDQDQKYTFTLTYEGGVYTTGVKSVKPGQTVAFDLRAMRDNQVPDQSHRTIPLNATRGKIVWSVRGPNSLGLLGRSEQVDLVKGTSSSYACFMCCPNSFRSSRIEPLSLSFPVGDVSNFRGVERDRTCYGAMVPEYYMGDTWAVDNTGVITISGFEDSADVTAVGAGSANVIGHWDVYTYTFQHNLDGPYCDTSSEVTAPTAPVAVRPSISGPHTLWWFNGQSPSGYSTQITLSTTSNANSWHWAVVSGASKVSLSGDDTDSVTITSNGKSDNQNDVGIQVSVDGQVSDQFNITILAPADLLQGTVIHVSDSTWGYATYINYYIRDQFTSQLPYGVPVNEQWTTNIVSDYLGMDWTRGNPHGFPASIAAFSDFIQGERSSHTPTPTAPSSGTTAVYHWGQDWYIGSTSPGSGRRVQSDTLQKYTDHAEHQNIVTPNP